MNAVEIEEAVSELVTRPFDPAEFAYQFLTAFGAKETTIKRLRKRETNASDVPGGVLQRNNIHVAVAHAGEVTATIAALRASARTAAQKAKFLLATDGETVEAEDLVSDEPPIACGYADLPRHFGFFLPLAGISTVKEIKNNPVDIKATGRLNRLYVELLKDNPDWAAADRRHELNQFMARLIFCFFAEDTGIFDNNEFTTAITRMSEAGYGSGDERWGNTHVILAELFRAMDTDTRHEGQLDDRHRRAAAIRPYANEFPFVNGGLFTGVTQCPRFSRTARAYLLRAGELDWREINPDIFGSMIQAVADEGERGELGMHYTSVPNILKVLNPLFLDSLREALAAAGESPRKLRALRRRLASIRVFDPACGSGNFLVIAYKEMRRVEAGIVERLGGEASLKLDDRRSVIPLSNFYGIEIKDFAAEIARLALLIAEFQADCLYLSQQEARAMVLPLHRTGQVTVGNALRVDWLAVCPPVAKTPSEEHDLAGPTGRMALEENGLGEGEAETYICGNPPYKGSQTQTNDQKNDLQLVFKGRSDTWKSVDYVGGWLVKAADYGSMVPAISAFVATNSVCQGRSVSSLWPVIFSGGATIAFAYTSFKWSNLAGHNAGVTVIVVGLTHQNSRERKLFSDGEAGLPLVRSVPFINAYLIPADNVIVSASAAVDDQKGLMSFGNMPIDGGFLQLDGNERSQLTLTVEQDSRWIRRIYGAAEFIRGLSRYCFWIADSDAIEAATIPQIAERLKLVQRFRRSSKRSETIELAATPHRFGWVSQNGASRIIVLPRISSEKREYIPVGLEDVGVLTTDQAYALQGAPLWNLSLLSSRIHIVWIEAVCGKMKTDLRYSNTLGWNTFPVPKLSERNKADLTACAEAILLAREAHFPATIADLYAPEAMPDDLRRAHDDNDETLERIYIGRRFRNDTERLEKLFAMYAEMTAGKGAGNREQRAGGRKAASA